MTRLEAAEKVCEAAELDLETGDWRPLVEALAAWRRIAGYNLFGVKVKLDPKMEPGTWRIETEGSHERSR